MSKFWNMIGQEPESAREAAKLVFDYCGLPFEFKNDGVVNRTYEHDKLCDAYTLEDFNKWPAAGLALLSITKLTPAKKRMHARIRDALLKRFADERWVDGWVKEKT